MDKDCPSAAGQGRHILLRIRPSSIITLVFLSFAALVMAYVAGVMSGRHQPIPEVKVETPSRVEEVKEMRPSIGEEVILAPEQLEFARVLRGEAKPVPKEELKTEIIQPEEKKAVPPDDTRPVSENTPSAQLFDYIFQLAAFRDENAADILRQKLEGYGMRTGLERNGKMFVVLVKMRGSEERAAELYAIATSLRLGEPLIKSKKPVNQ